MDLVYNIGVAKSEGISSNHPLDLGNYPTIMPVQSFSFKGITYQIRTIIPVVAIDGDYVFLPCSPGENGQNIADSLIYIVKFKYTPDSSGKPIDVLKYIHGSFGEDCIARCAPGNEPILLNKVRNIFDYGSSGRTIDLNQVALPENNDTIKFVFDYLPMKDGSIQIVAFTKKSLTIAAILNNAKIEMMTILKVPEQPIACAFLPDERLITINSKGKYLITRQFKDVICKPRVKVVVDC